jgi:hypothetical protein
VDNSSTCGSWGDVRMAIKPSQGVLSKTKVGITQRFLVRVDILYYYYRNRVPIFRFRIFFALRLSLF